MDQTILTPDGHLNRSGTEADQMAQRQKTFVGWRGKKNYVQLAIAGFQYTGISDKVECPTCKLKLCNWQGTEDAVELHKSRSPDCEFIKRWYCDSARNATVSDANVEKSNNSLQPPKHPDFRDYQKRLDSYNGWQLHGDLQSPPRMADEGFFYVGSRDRVRCFHCGLTLVDWDDDDMPFDVHVLYSPECVFAQDRVKAQQKSQKEANMSASDRSRQTNGFSNGVDSETIGVAKSSRYSPMIAAVVEFGYSVDAIQRVIQEEKRRSGKDFPDACALLLALDLQ